MRADDKSTIRGSVDQDRFVGKMSVRAAAVRVECRMKRGVKFLSTYRYSAHSNVDCEESGIALFSYSTPLLLYPCCRKRNFLHFDYFTLLIHIDLLLMVRLDHLLEYFQQIVDILSFLYSSILEVKNLFFLPYFLFWILHFLNFNLIHNIMFKIWLDQQNLGWINKNLVDFVKILMVHLVLSKVLVKLTKFGVLWLSFG